ncbi:MAG: signal peptidase II, partial [Enterococcus sp.]|nr:signal peptidase II [Enterococcus sp.]
MPLKKKIAIFIALGLVLIFIDQLSKFIVLAGNFYPGQKFFCLIPGLLSFTFVKNTGAAWGIFQDSTLALSIISLVVVFFLIVYVFILDKNINKLVFYASILICAGGIGNVISRFINGYVVDFIKFDFINFPVFNIADICVTIGFVLALVGLFFEFKSEYKNNKA